MSKDGFGKIVVAFDGSPDSLKAVKRASALAKEFGATITIVHAYTLPALGYGGPGPMPLVDFKSIEDSARSKARETLEKGKTICEQEGVSAKVELLQATSIVQAIVEFAAKENADLIVMGTRGMTGFKKMLMGSVSDGVVSHAHCSVLVVR